MQEQAGEITSLQSIQTAVENLGEQVYRAPGARNFEFKGWAVPELARALRTTVHSDIAEALMSGDNLRFKEAQRRLGTIIRDGSDKQLIDEISEVLGQHPSPIIKNKEKPRRGRKRTQQKFLPFEIKESDIEPVTKGKRGGCKPKILPPSPTLTGVNIQSNPSKTLLAVSLGGPKGVISPEMQESNPWRDDLIIDPNDRDGLMNSMHAIRPGTPPRKILKDAGHAKKKAHLSKVTNRMGAKEKLMQRYDTENEPYIPRQRFTTFIDAFGGSLAVTAYMVRTGRVGPETHTVICEKHPHLAVVYRAIRMDVEKLIKHLEEFKKGQSREFYEGKVAEFNLARDLKKEEDDIYVAARYIYLLASCIGSTLRESKNAGHINVIPRKEKELRKIKIFNPSNLRKMSIVLQNATIIEGAHEEVRRFIEEDCSNACYFADPPYHGQETTSEYGVPPFDENCQRSVAETAKMVNERGGTSIVTNSDTQFIRKLYGWMTTKKTFSVEDSLSGVEGQKRQELFLSNYALRWMGSLI